MAEKKRRCRSVAVLLAASAVLALCLLPRFFCRVQTESKNDRVVMSLLYSDIKNKISADALPEYLDRSADAGVTAVSLPEDSMGFLTARGDIVGVRYHDIRREYDVKSEKVEALLEGVRGIEYDSHVFLVKRREIIEKFDEWLPLYYTDADYIKAGEVDGYAVYVFYDGNISLYDLPVGYDEAAISEISEHGLDVALIMRVGAHGSTGYIERVGGIVEKYGVRYLNIKADYTSKDSSPNAEENARGIASLVSEHALTLVLTEKDDQLSNIRCIGYDEIFDAADGMVMRSYETHDCSQADSTGYMFRSRQYINSVRDRNIRFVTVTQISIVGRSNTQLADDTLAAVKETRYRLGKLGFDTESGGTRLDYEPSATYVFAFALSFTVLLATATIAVVFSLDGVVYTVASLLLAAEAFGVTFIMPRSLLLLYPTVTALTVPCLSLALALAFLRSFRDKMRSVPLFSCVCAVMLATVAIGGFVMASLTSGLGYYVNNDIFRGIKLSLYAPLLFAAAAYYFMSVWRRGEIVADIKTALSARVRVWWCLLAAAAAVVSFIYIRRSGNVSSISSVEAAMRNFMTDHMTARPRTKEFLFGYPCAALLVISYKNSGRRVLPWIMAVGTAILPASLMNTFCHVFTDVSVQYGRVLWGLLIGIFTSAAVFALAYLYDAVRLRLGRAGKTDISTE